MRFPVYAKTRVAVGGMALAAVCMSAAQSASDVADPIIRRTEFGVPHITASDFRGIGIGLGYAQAEDYGERVIIGLVASKGWMGRTFGKDSMASDFSARLTHDRVEETFHLLDADTRAVYEGFAEGVNRYIRSHRDRVPSWAAPVFNGHDVAVFDIGRARTGPAQQMVLRRLGADSGKSPDTNADADADADTPYNEDGSNAWALAPSRTKSGRAILLRNPHLAWTAGYWEAHITVSGKIDFYGDFRIGSPFAVIAGFNNNLGWATTNNATDLDEVYALDIDPADTNAYLFDGVSVPIRAITSTVSYTTDRGLETETRQFWTTPLGPVVHRTASTLYVVRATTDGEYRGGAQFLAMMRATNLAEWKAALAMRARATSNLTYADRAGNIFTIWMASLPSLPHPSGGDSTFVRARTSADIWTSLVPLESLPQTLNPKGGYVHNENDAPHYANLNAILDPAHFPANVERGELRLRSQLALQLIGGKQKFSLEDVVALKHNYRMLLADRVKDDLIAATRKSLATETNATSAQLTNAVTVLSQWDNTAAPDSRGSVLFDVWWRRYARQARDSAYAEPWTLSKLTETPRGLGMPALAVQSLAWAANSVQQVYGALDIPWGDVHRVVRGTVNVPVGGCSGALGCFRVLAFEQRPDGKAVANSGDGWVLAVEFGAKTPRAYSVLAYGQSPDSLSPHYADQAAMFARGEFKPVWFQEADIAAHTVRTYTP